MGKMSRLPDGITRYKVTLDGSIPKLNGNRHVETVTLEVEVIADHPTQAIELAETWATERVSTVGDHETLSRRTLGVEWTPADTPVRKHWNQEVC
jgi:hypothetical protein